MHEHDTNGLQDKSSVGCPQQSRVYTCVHTVDGQAGRRGKTDSLVPVPVHRLRTTVSLLDMPPNTRLNVVNFVWCEFNRMNRKKIVNNSPCPLGSVQCWVRLTISWCVGF